MMSNFLCVLLAAALCAGVSVAMTPPSRGPCVAICRLDVAIARRDCVRRPDCVVTRCARPVAARTGHICSKRTATKPPTSTSTTKPATKRTTSGQDYAKRGAWVLSTCLSPRMPLPTVLFGRVGSPIVYNTDFTASAEEVACFNASHDVEIRWHIDNMDATDCAPLTLPTNLWLGVQRCPNLTGNLCPAAMEAMLAMLRHDCS